MIRIGITGQSGFVGTNLFNSLQRFPKKYQLISFKDNFFYRDELLNEFVKYCDVIIHLAAIMRSPIKGEVYHTNVELVNKLITSMNNCHVTPCILFSSSIQDNMENEYGKSKRMGIALLKEWAHEYDTGFVAMRFPNLFGPYAKPNYSSFIATFCYKLSHDETPFIIQDNDIPLIYIGNLVKYIMEIIDNTSINKTYSLVNFTPDKIIKVSDVLKLLEAFKQANKNGMEPVLSDEFEHNLYNTYQSYINYNI